MDGDRGEGEREGMRGWVVGPHRRLDESPVALLPRAHAVAHARAAPVDLVDLGRLLGVLALALVGAARLAPGLALLEPRLRRRGRAIGLALGFGVRGYGVGVTLRARVGVRARVRIGVGVRVAGAPGRRG